MTLRLPRLRPDMSLTQALGRPTIRFMQWWQSLVEDIESAVNDLTTVQADIDEIQAIEFTAGNGLTGGGNILATPVAFAVGAGSGIVVASDTVSVSANLQAYDGGDTPSVFTLSIVDSVDAAAWRAAIGASATTGTVTSVGMTVPTGFAVSGSPVTTSGTLAVTYAAGYQGYTSTEAAKLAGIAPGATANTGTVTSVAFSGGTTGLTVSGSPITTSGTITLSGTLAVANGGTGVTTSTGTGSGVHATQPQFTSTIGVGAAASASGSGVSFPATQSASTDPNTLDDYEEGTWTPTVGAYSGSLTSYTATGAYTKIGRQVAATVTIDITTNGTAAGGLYYDLPFTAASIPCVGSGRVTLGTGVGIIVEVPGGTIYAQLTTYDNLYPGGTGYRIIATVTYFV